MSKSGSPRTTGPFMRRNASLLIWLAYVIVPVDAGGLIHGVPLGPIEAFALLIIAWLAVYRERIPGAAVVAADVGRQPRRVGSDPGHQWLSGAILRKRRRDRALRARHGAAGQPIYAGRRSSRLRSRGDRISSGVLQRQHTLQLITDRTSRIGASSNSPQIGPASGGLRRDAHPLRGRAPVERAGVRRRRPRAVGVAGSRPGQQRHFARRWLASSECHVLLSLRSSASVLRRDAARRSPEAVRFDDRAHAAGTPVADDGEACAPCDQDRRGRLCAGMADVAVRDERPPPNRGAAAGCVPRPRVEGRCSRSS